jgi:hypothetical protein
MMASYTASLMKKVEELHGEVKETRAVIDPHFTHWVNKLGKDQLLEITAPAKEVTLKDDPEMKLQETLDACSKEISIALARHYLLWLESFGRAHPDIASYIGTLIDQVEAYLSACDRLHGYERAIGLHVVYEKRRADALGNDSE